MVVLRQAGGPSGRGSFRFVWQGATIARQIDAAVAAALANRASAALGLLRSELHRDTGQMADEAFAEVDTAGGKRTLRLGSDAPHTYWHETGGAYPAHPQIRAIADRIAPTITPAIRAAMGRG
jgi:hypothetical protein